MYVLRYMRTGAPQHTPAHAPKHAHVHIGYLKYLLLLQVLVVVVVVVVVWFGSDFLIFIRNYRTTNKLTPKGANAII